MKLTGSGLLAHWNTWAQAVSQVTPRLTTMHFGQYLTTMFPELAKRAELQDCENDFEAFVIASQSIAPEDMESYTT